MEAETLGQLARGAYWAGEIRVVHAEAETMRSGLPSLTEEYAVHSMGASEKIIGGA